MLGAGACRAKSFAKLTRLKPGFAGVRDEGAGAHMQWSKIKTRLMALVCPTLRGHIDFHLTVYRTHHTDDGNICRCKRAREFWITIDGLKVFRASYCKYAFEAFVMWANTGVSPWDRGPQQAEAVKIFERRELHDPDDVVTLLKSYLDLDPRMALRSNDPVLRALAIIDRRIGVRTLQQLKVEDDEHSLVRMFYWLRCSGQRREPAPRRLQDRPHH
jgi:hypothetical protein